MKQLFPVTICIFFFRSFALASFIIAHNTDVGRYQIKAVFATDPRASGTSRSCIRNWNGQSAFLFLFARLMLMTEDAVLR